MCGRFLFTASREALANRFHLDDLPELPPRYNVAPSPQGPGGEVIESTTIVTTSANELLRPLHERMPVILPPEHYALWLDPRHEEPSDLLPLLVPYPDRLLTVYRVSNWVSNARHEGERCL